MLAVVVGVSPGNASPLMLGRHAVVTDVAVERNGAYGDRLRSVHVGDSVAPNVRLVELVGDVVRDRAGCLDRTEADDSERDERSKLHVVILGARRSIESVERAEGEKPCEGDGESCEG